ncbi:uncharacterized protein LOC101888693 [Musca domestica]|uniref:Uncharacterized protein LOC101888693 n=1 Tax=Musca domestica TaxID=7370 RepID=A0A1I8MM33_MUSDO|nr:uncharacterized protein LOC101888693 [Musca domestica]
MPPKLATRVGNKSPWFCVACVMAILAIIIYACLTAYNVTGLLIYYQIIEEQTKDTDPDVWTNELRALLKHISAINLYANIASLFVYVVMLILSVLMIVGLEMKRHQFISPWLVAGCIMVGCGFCLNIVTSQRDSLLDYIVMGLQIFTWFPVYTYYKKLRPTRYWKQYGFINVYRVWDQPEKFHQWRGQFPIFLPNKSCTSEGEIKA